MEHSQRFKFEPSDEEIKEELLTVKKEVIDVINETLQNENIDSMQIIVSYTDNLALWGPHR